MHKYLINITTNEVHVADSYCSRLPSLKNSGDLGRHRNSKEAIFAAILMGYKNADGCAYCCQESHTK